jgi:hypothetical protein
MSKPNSVSLHIVVSGTETEIDANENVPIRSIIERALAQTHNQGRDVAEWELRDANGQLFEPGRTVESYSLASGTLLYLQPKVGVNGDTRK